jgi:hypothetical protein
LLFIRDPHGALEEQIQMICQLKDVGYTMLVGLNAVTKESSNTYIAANRIQKRGDTGNGAMQGYTSSQVGIVV